MSGVRHFVSSQLTPHPIVDTRGKLKAGFHLDETLRLMGAHGVTSTAGGSFGAELIDRLLALYPIPRDWAGLGAVCRRIYSIYGPVFKPENLNLETGEALGQLFGFSNLTAFDQISLMLRKQQAVDAKGEDCYLPQVKRLALPITIVHGAENTFFQPEGSERTYEWLRENNGIDLYSRYVIPGYSHLDCFIGTDASRDVFPTILKELDAHN
jgi:cholesterol oxidase